MHDRTLLMISLITGCLGLIVLIILLQTGEHDSFSQFESEMDEVVKINGVATKVTQRNNITIITLKTEQEVTVIVFEAVNVSQGASLSIQGSVEEYKGKKEIIAEAIMLMPKTMEHTQGLQSSST